MLQVVIEKNDAQIVVITWIGVPSSFHFQNPRANLVPLSSIGDPELMYRLGLGPGLQAQTWDQARTGPHIGLAHPVLTHIGLARLVLVLTHTSANL